MRALELKPTQKPIRDFCAALRELDDLGVSHEGAGMREIPRSALPHKFAHELHANEIMLLL